MKKALIAFLVLVVLSVLLIYLVIPEKIEIERTEYVDVAPDLAYRQVSAQSAWKRWSPEDGSAKKQSNAGEEIVHHNIRYTIKNQMLGPIPVIISTDGSEFNSTLIVVPLKRDSTALHWKCLVETGSNPFEKVTSYFRSKQIANGMKELLDSLQLFLAKRENRYNILIERTRVTDTILVTTKTILDHYPSTEEIYEGINKLKRFVQSRNAKETNDPMLHILKLDSTRYEVMVAIPVDQRIGNNEDIVYKRMVPGNILVSKVQGGRYTIENAFAEMETYAKDHELMPPAIPFESLETNRLSEPDTTRWITRIYFPVL